MIAFFLTLHPPFLIGCPFLTDLRYEKDLMHKEKLRLVHETLLMLTETSPTDAYLVKLHLEGYDYRQMAEKRRDRGYRKSICECDR